MIRLRIKGWEKLNQFPSESCLPAHLYYSSEFQSIKLIQLIRSHGFNLNESKRAIENVMNGEDFLIDFTDEVLANEFSRKAKKYGAKVVKEH